MSPSEPGLARVPDALAFPKASESRNLAMSSRANFVEYLLRIFLFLKIIFFLLKMYFQASFLMRKPATLAAFILCLKCGHPDSAANKSPFDDLYAWKKHIESRKIAIDHIEG